ncbi:pilus assembly protein TadG-related protein [Nocardiopsis trehalosi]|uniref:pilus assembly protein TadG-related protein n=1 Tax=Nocardiopsis trehalosi TaxID=109329 RepID=UPI0008351C66|nr:pilus assembly protein TadG-related protein [Nocardiopsis trehalosi]
MRSGTHDGGQVTAFVLVLATAVLTCLGLVADGGTMLIDRTRAMALAQEAARLGAQQVDMAALVTTGDSKLVLDARAAEREAQAYLAEAGASGTVTATRQTVSVEARVPYSTVFLPLGDGMARARAQAAAITP